MPSRTTTTPTSTVPTATIREVRIAPVAAQPGSLHMLPTPLVDSIMSRHPGKYSGHVEDWPEWRRRWLPFLREVEAAWPGMGDGQRLALLRGALDEASAMVVDSRVEAQPEESYDNIFAALDLDFGGEDKAALRRKMTSLRLPPSGKLTEKAWREYWAKLSQLATQVGATEEEVGRLTVEALPTQYQRRLATEEDKRMDVMAVHLEGLPGDVTVEEVATMVEAETGRRPKAVRKVGKKMRVVAEDDTHRTAVKAVYDRHRLEGGELISVTPDSYELSGKEVNDFLVRWLRVETRLSAGKEREMVTEKRPASKWQREIGAEEPR
jgi:hypothetical protein